VVFVIVKIRLRNTVMIIELRLKWRLTYTIMLSENVKRATSINSASELFTLCVILANKTKQIWQRM